MTNVFAYVDAEDVGLDGNDRFPVLILRIEDEGEGMEVATVVDRNGEFWQLPAGLLIDPKS